MKYDELKSHNAYNRWIDEGWPTPNDDLICCEYYLKSEVDEAIAELKAKLESVQASAYADSVDAGMRECRLRRALYKACAMWAYRTRLICSVFGSSAPKIRWERMYEKCLKKSEEYQ